MILVIAFKKSLSHNVNMQINKAIAVPSKQISNTLFLYCIQRFYEDEITEVREFIPLRQKL